MSSRATWVNIIQRELVKHKNVMAVAVTLRSSVRFSGKVTDAPETSVLTLYRAVTGIDRATYVDLDEVAAIEVL